MAADCYLATHFVQVPTLRLYRWDPPALSLGFHQAQEKVDWDSCRRNGVDIVRRPTGGRSVFHAHELTYSVILPRDAEFATGGVHAVHNRISQALASGIQSIGINISLREQTTNFRQHYRHPGRGVACFTASAKYELQSKGKKVVGSAQRIFPETILQHGSILLGAAHRRIVDLLDLTDADRQQLSDSLANSTVELETLAGRDIAVEALTESITRTWQEEFRCSLDPEPLAQEERNRIHSNVNQFVITPSHASISDYS